MNNAETLRAEIERLQKELDAEIRRPALSVRRESKADAFEGVPF